MNDAEKEAIEHPPHVHRLLRLIREGTPSHASRASVLLGRYAASCCAGVVGVSTGAADRDADQSDGDNKEETHAASSINPGLIIWDLIGRLVGGDDHTANHKSGSTTNVRGKRKKKKKRPTSGLFDSDWATRSNCALALEYVARCLPLEDRRNFFEGDDDDTANSSNEKTKHENDDEVMLWLNVNDLRKLLADGTGKKQPDVKIEGKQSTQADATGGHHDKNNLDIVAERGRLLLSSSGAQYDWDCDDEANEYIREQEELQNLDATAAQPTQQEVVDSKNCLLQRSFLMRRVTLQRQILARRLGLGGILSAPIVAGYDQRPEENASSSCVKRGHIVDDIIADEDLAPPTITSSDSKGKHKTSKTAVEKNGEPSKKRRRTKKSEPEHNDKEENGPVVSIRALLVLESKRAADDINYKHTRHRNPQTLLGSELAYRTFDPDWSVRHGALLGTLALLRAWKVHEAPRVSRNNNSKQHRTKFGRWPQDILARCICILALDQFADFSGAACQSSDSTESTDDIASGAIVAPVREMAAQIITILLEASPPEIGSCAHDLLMQLYTRQSNMMKQRGNNGWEIRHGVLLTWKYVCAMALFYSHRKGQPQSRLNDMVKLRPLSTNKNQNNDLARCHFTFNNLILQSIRGLSDASDDNKAIASQVLRYSLLIDASLHTIDVAGDCSKLLWDAIIKIRADVSSCAADLLHLLAELLSRDCPSFLSCLQEMMGSLSLDSILQKLTDFISDDSIHVKISCFCALRLVAEPIARAILDGVSTRQSDCTIAHVQPKIDCAITLCRLLDRLFETFFSPEYTICRGGGASSNGNETNDDHVQELSNYRNQAWSSVLGSLALLSQSNSTEERSPCLGIIDDTFSSLTLRYLGISRSPISLEDAKKSYNLTRITDTIGVGEMATENSYRSRLTSAHALALFHEKIYLEAQPAILSESICAILQSPWLSHCEAGHLLHMSLARSAKRDSTGLDSHPFFLQYLPLMINAFDRPPSSILLEDHAAASVALHDPKVQSICDDGLVMILDSSENCSSDEIVQMWQTTFIQRGVSLENLRKSYTKSSTKASMRLSASISGALVACGAKHLPQKVTPLIRSLMTSLKNEESHQRRVETCRYISVLVSILSSDATYEKARNKLIENVCLTACNRHADSSGPSKKGAAHVIELLVASMSSDQKLEDFPSIYDRLSPLLDEHFSGTSEQKVSDAIFILEVISRSISKHCHCFKRYLESFTRSAVDVACTSDSELLKTQACTSIKNFCRIDFCATMDMAVPSLLPNLSNLHDDQGREGGCKLLLSLLHDFEVLVAPYVSTLLPVAMRLMTDSLEECARLGASAFAILVRIAPLAASYTDKDAGTLSTGDESTEGCKNASNDVIRHLILGKPLPPCILPEIVSSELRKSDTVLRPYQIEGISWLKFLTDVHLNGTLCDDMGLGKTLQALIAVAISHHGNPGESNNSSHRKKSLVVCPSSVVGHWVSEIQRFFPSNKIFTPFDFTGSAKRRRVAWHDSIHKSDIVVTSYSVLRTDIKILEDILWDYCILDEGHLLKNPKTATAKASRRLKATHKLILTGTPIQNNVHEIWATFDFLMPNFLGTERSFLNEFAKPIIKSQSSDASAADINQGMETLKILHQQVLPFVLRREKSQVIRELPPKIITDVPCLLSNQQSAMYRQTLNKSGMKEALDTIDSSLKDGEQSSDASPPQLGSDVLTSLLQLRLICTHPLLHSLFLSKNSDSPKASSSKSMDTSRSYTRLDCSGKLSTLNDLLRHAGIAEPEITAADNDESGFLVDVNENNTDDSSDIDFIGNGNSIDVLDDSQGADSPELATNSSKCLIFAQFTQSLDIVERLLFEPHMPSLQYLRLDGRIPSNKRNSVVDRFNQDDNIKVLLLTTKVGGLGLNLTGADKVIFLEPDWNPFVDLQAMDRAHRIGQTKTVNVYRLITSDTIEEKMMKLQRQKRATSEAVVNADNSTMFSMGTDRLLDIFTCRGGESSTTASASSQQQGDDNVLSYLDSDKQDEYSSLSVDGFMRGLA